MRLLLDELYTKAIAEQLRDLGHDVVAVSERPELVGLPDAELFSLMVTERRAIVTENWADFSQLVANALVEDAEHYGIVFTSAKSLPRSKSTIGRYVTVLAKFLEDHAADDALRNSVRWLP